MESGDAEKKKAKRKLVTKEDVDHHLENRAESQERYRERSYGRTSAVILIKQCFEKGRT